MIYHFSYTFCCQVNFHAPGCGHTTTRKGAFKNPGDAQKTGMEDAALRPRFRAVQRFFAEL